MGALIDRFHIDFTYFQVVICALLFRSEILPVTARFESPRDVWWKKSAAMTAFVTGPFAAIVRYLHMYYDRYTWSWPLLVIEIILIDLCGVFLLMGNWDLMQQLDREHPFQLLA